MGARDEYLRILAAHGRRVANRFAYAELREANGGLVATSSMSELGEACVEMYGSEEHLPEHERSRPDDPLLEFDPLMMLGHYPKNWPAIRVRKVKGTTQDWPGVFYETRKVCGIEGLGTVLGFIGALLEGDERALALLDQPSNEEWKALEESWNATDLLALHLIVFRRFPKPDSPVAKIWLNSRAREGDHKWES
jgi:hypothetical protein